MEGVVSHFQHYMQTGGITMYPLLLCCFSMWLLILFHLPAWRHPLSIECKQLQKQYLLQTRDNLRHDRQVYDHLVNMSYQRTARGISTIKLLATIAPILGLFGTVTGMINTFESVADFGLGNPKALAAGISEAMITTQFGLFVALPGILAVFFLHRRASRDQQKIKLLTVELVNTGGKR